MGETEKNKETNKYIMCLVINAMKKNKAGYRKGLCTCVCIHVHVQCSLQYDQREEHLSRDLKAVRSEPGRDLGMNIPGRKNSMCKGPEAGMRLALSRNNRSLHDFQ